MQQTSTPEDEKNLSSEAIRSANPRKIRKSEFNERGVMTARIDDLAESIRTQGVIQPPLVRELADDPDGYEYDVIAGWRRTLAAQKAQEAVDDPDAFTIPVIVVQWDDADALAASITENADTFRFDASYSDRTTAVKRYYALRKEQMDDGETYTHKDLAEDLGVEPSEIQKWFERAKDSWYTAAKKKKQKKRRASNGSAESEPTPPPSSTPTPNGVPKQSDSVYREDPREQPETDPRATKGSRVDEPEPSDEFGVMPSDADYIPDGTLQSLRRMVWAYFRTVEDDWPRIEQETFAEDRPDDFDRYTDELSSVLEFVDEHRVEDGGKGISERDAEEARDIVSKGGATPVEALERVYRRKNDPNASTDQTGKKFFFGAPPELAEGFESAAARHGLSDEELALAAIRTYLAAGAPDPAGLSDGDRLEITESDYLNTEDY